MHQKATLGTHRASSVYVLGNYVRLRCRLFYQLIDCLGLSASHAATIHLQFNCSRASTPLTKSLSENCSWLFAVGQLRVRGSRLVLDMVGPLNERHQLWALWTVRRGSRFAVGYKDKNLPLVLLLSSSSHLSITANTYSITETCRSPTINVSFLSCPAPIITLLTKSQLTSTHYHSIENVEDEFFPNRTTKIRRSGHR